MIFRSPFCLSLALAFTTLLLQYSPVKGDADIESVRIHHGYEDMSGRGGDPKAKYWRKYSAPSLDAHRSCWCCLQMSRCKSYCPSELENKYAE